ncbi:MAG: RNA-directed DNA polymerase [Candidatus Sumerlaeia bacterium]|nr:RNA-directed DNA polymerase [Candidatus Sumerlaeia bacterium]
MTGKLRDIWPSIATFSNLARAHRLARRGKLKRPEVARFHLNWELEVVGLEEELATLSWQPGPFRTFTIYEGKARVISAVPYRDRVVHQAIMNHLAPHLERSFVFDTFACRTGKGTEAARARAQHFLRRHRYFLHLDAVKYFPSIPQPRLKEMLRRHVGDGHLLEILERIIDHDGSPLPGDLVEWSERRGLPIGSLTSQWFANLYLSPLDHFIKERLRVPGYVRYMDDMVFFANDKEELWQAEGEARRFLEEKLGLRMHKNPRLAPSSEGLSFLGMQIFPTYRRLLPPSGYRFQRRMAGVLRAYDKGAATREKVICQYNGWLGHARLANTVALRRSIRESLSQGRPPGVRTA